MRVHIFGGNSDTAKAIIKEVEDGVLVTREEVDVTDGKAVMKYMAKHKPEVIVNCAGCITPGSVKDSDPSEWFKQIKVNLMGSYFLAKYALENGCKVIIFIGSTSGLKGRKDWSAYCASKAGLISLTESLIEEGVEAYCINPGRMKTAMRKKLFPDEDPKTLLDPRAIGKVVSLIAMGAYQPGCIGIRKELEV